MGGDLVTTQQLSCWVFKRGKEIKNQRSNKFDHEKGAIDQLALVDQYQYLGNFPPTPPLTQQQSVDNKLGLMLG